MFGLISGLKWRPPLGLPRAAALAIALAALLPSVEASAASRVIKVSSEKTTQISVAKGKPQTLRTSTPFYEIVIGDPEIANVNPLTDSSFYVLGNNL
ncbi:MAG: pilus assembly protein N-terminal domain-containing protein, partial [Pseudorhodoplanes sp.]